MDLTHPMDKFEVADVLAMATADRQRILVVGGRTHADKGNPCDVDAELWTTQLDGLVSYEPAEMIVVAEAGMRVGELDRILAEGGQEWPSDAPPEATVGGVIAAAANSPRRLKVGPVRDTVIEMEVVTGDGRLVKSGARTVKSVAGYDVHKLMTGSLGTLGVIVQVALKVRPRPPARRTVRIPGGLEAALRVLEAVPNPAAVLATPPGGGASPGGVARGGGRADRGGPKRGRHPGRRRRRAVPGGQTVGGAARRGGGRGRSIAPS